MAYMIDGHNLIMKIPGMSLAQLDKEQVLIGILQKYCHEHRCKAEVYFDAAPPGYDRSENLGRVNAHYVRQGLTADLAIISRLKRLQRSARNWIVVSSDRQLQFEAHSLGASVLSSEKYASLLFAAPEVLDVRTPSVKRNGLSENDLDQWMQLFGEE